MRLINLSVLVFVLLVYRSAYICALRLCHLVASASASASASAAAAAATAAIYVHLRTCKWPSD